MLSGLLDKTIWRFCRWIDARRNPYDDAFMAEMNAARKKRAAAYGRKPGPDPTPGRVRDLARRAV